MQVVAAHPDQLTDGDVAAWRQLLAADVELSSPYLTPDWTRLVACHRGDVRVAVWRDDSGAAHAFLPAQLSGSYAAMPVGGPICDYQALIAARDADLDISDVVTALGVSRLDLPAGLRNNAVGASLLTQDAGHVVRFASGWDAWCADRQASGSKIVSRVRKRLSKLTRDHEPGAVVFEPFSTDASAFETLIGWKRAQMKRTGVTDIFAHGWIDAVVREAFAVPADHAAFGSAMFVLRVRGAPVAVLFCLRAEKALHAWFIAHDPAFADYSPGLILIAETIRASASAGFTEMDLGPGEYQFKESFANHARPIGAGFIGRPGLATALKSAEFQVRALVENLPVGRVRQWPAKAMRRLDIARGLAAPPNRAA